MTTTDSGRARARSRANRRLRRLTIGTAVLGVAACAPASTAPKRTSAASACDAADVG